MDKNRKSLYIDVKNIPAYMMHDDRLKEFLSVFGAVKSITRSMTNKAHATVEFIDQSLRDPFEGVPDVPPEALSDLPIVRTSIRTESMWLNEKFLSDLMSNLEFNHKNRLSRDENQNVTDSLESNTSYLDCTYCYSLADYVCERCQSPYCSTRCQRIDWLKHKKYCAKIKPK